MFADGSFLMTDNNEQFNDGGSREFSDETIRRFLLGRLSASERPLFERHFITHDGLDARVRLAEFDLADDYAFERLSTTDRKLFEQRFLLASNRQHQLRVSKALRDRFSSTTATAFAGRPERNAAIERLRHLLGLDRPAWRIAFAVLILVILFGAVWLVIKEPRIARQITNRIIPRRSTPAGAPREAGHPANTSTPEHQTTPSPMPEHDRTGSPAVAVTIALRPAASPQTSEMPALDLPKGDQDVVRLQLALQRDQTGLYRAELLTIEASSVLSSDSLKPNDSRAAIDFDVSARLLKAGNYQVKLRRVDGGSKGSVATYYFRVQ
jgi:hypothetical protein